MLLLAVEYEFDSSSTTFCVESKKYPKAKAISTFIVFASSHFPLLINIYPAINFNLQAGHDWHVPILLKPS